ncbi:hypothetical protein WJX72_005432 [[Myrmecia] bisecta]|uniref:Carbohydrate kinase PfkB domain-containing protein n=1 Tax=[Myrmecia] bisecta TaxID=41462 RepID=A0AAW1R6B1_9CHLO
MPQRVVALGDPVMDVLAHVDASMLESTLSLEPGGCHPISQTEMAGLLVKIGKHHRLARVPGGSAANVVTGIANLSNGSWEVCFMGMLGADETGREYRTRLEEQGVRSLMTESTSGASTATCLCLVTPDGQRTMRTCLAAAQELASADMLPEGWADSCRLLHCEGYTLYRPQLAAEAMRRARQAGAQVSMDLASFEVIRNCTSALQSLLDEGLVDIVFCNEEEAEALAQVAGVTVPGDPQATRQGAQEYLLRNCQVSVVSVGPEGCIARARNGEVGTSPACQVTVEDTIGAGDTFSSGFLHAYLSGANLQACCACGCAAGAEAVQTAGADLKPATWSRLRQKAAAILGAHGNDAVS